MEYIIDPGAQALTIIQGRHAAPAVKREKSVLSEKQFVALYRAHYEELHRYADRFLQDPVRAQDAVQEGFLRVWKRKDVLNAGPHVRALLYKSVRNLCMNALRNDKTQADLRSNVPELEAPPAPDELALSAQIKEQIDRWVAEMPPRRREVFELSRYNQLSYREIADVMGVSVKTVENHLLYALRYLRDKLNVYDPKLLQS